MQNELTEEDENLFEAVKVWMSSSLSIKQILPQQIDLEQVKELATDHKL